MPLGGAVVFGPKRLPRYKIPVAYAELLEGIIRKEPLLKPAEVDEKLISALSITAANKPADYAADEKIKQKVYEMEQKI